MGRMALEMRQVPQISTELKQRLDRMDFGDQGVRVLAYFEQFRDEGLSDDQLYGLFAQDYGDLYADSNSLARAGRRALVLANMVRDSGRKHETVSGAQAIIWVMVDPEVKRLAKERASTWGRGRSR